MMSPTYTVFDQITTTRTFRRHVGDVLATLPATDINEGVPRAKAAQVCLDNLAQIKCQRQFINAPERMEQLRARLEVYRSLGRTDEFERLDKEESMVGEMQVLQPILTVALRMYNTGGNVLKTRAFAKKHTRAIFVLVFGLSPVKSMGKKLLWKELENAVAGHPEKLAAVVGLTLTAEADNDPTTSVLDVAHALPPLGSNPSEGADEPSTAH